MNPPGQLIIDALNTTTPTARFRPPSQWNIDALHTATPKPRHETPQIDCLREMSPSSEGFNTHLWGFQGDRWENVHWSFIFIVNLGM